MTSLVKIYSSKWSATINSIQKQFLSCSNHYHELLKDLAICCKHYDGYQNEIFLNTAYHKLNLKHPVRISYQKKFFKDLIDQFESDGIEISERIYSYYFTLLQSDNSSDTYFIHYVIPIENKIVTVKEKSAIISDGTTGLVAWQAGKVLAEYCMLNKGFFENKKIFEFGSGVGVTGISTILTLEPKEYIFSDIHKTVLDFLCNSISISLVVTANQNTASVAFDSSVFLRTRYKDTVVSVLKFDWNRLTDLDISYIQNTDVILAADIVYDPDLFRPLCESFIYFTKFNPSIDIIIACTIRNWNTFNDFINFLSSFGFKLTEFHTPKSTIFNYNPNSVRIGSVRLKK